MTIHSSLDFITLLLSVRYIIHTSFPWFAFPMNHPFSFLQTFIAVTFFPKSLNSIGFSWIQTFIISHSLSYFFHFFFRRIIDHNSFLALLPLSNSVALLNSNSIVPVSSSLSLLKIPFLILPERCFFQYLFRFSSL